MNRNTKNQQLRGIVELMLDSYAKGDKAAVVALIYELVEIMRPQHSKQALAKS